MEVWSTDLAMVVLCAIPSRVGGGGGSRQPGSMAQVGFPRAITEPWEVFPWYRVL